MEWGVECGVQDMEWTVERSVECGEECGEWKRSVECGVWSGLWRGAWSVERSVEWMAVRRGGVECGVEGAVASGPKCKDKHAWMHKQRLIIVALWGSPVWCVPCCWGKCGEPWMQGHCCSTCFRCVPGCGRA